MTCLDEMMLEKVLLGAAPEGLAHSLQCQACAQKLDQMRAENEDFRRFVFPATVDAVVASRERRSWSLMKWFAPAGALAAAAAVAAFLVFAPATGPGADYIGPKGETLGLSLFTLDEHGAAVQLDDGASVPASAKLRFQVAPKKACYLWIVSVDDKGQLSRIYPESGDVSQQPAGRATLPGGATLDGQAGPERFFGVCSPSALPYEALLQALKLPPSAEAVRQLRRLPVDKAAVQGTVLLEKRP